MPDLLRETFEAYALRAPSADGLRDAVAERVRRDRGRRRWTAVTAATVTAAAVVAGLLVRSDGAPSREKGVRTPLVTAPEAPDGMAWFGWRGVEVLVPRAWLLPKFDSCGSIQTDGVIAGGTPSDGDCASRPGPHLDVVTFTVREAYDVEPLGNARDVVVSGIPAVRVGGPAISPWDGETTGQHAEALLVNERDVAVLVTSDDPATVKRVLDSVRIAPERDSWGCAVRRDVFWPGTAPAREGAGERMVPGTPLQASVCRYSPRNGWLHGSALVVDDVAELAAAFDEIGDGIDPSSVVAAATSTFVVTFRYAEGPDVEVVVAKEPEGGAGVSNGAVTGFATAEVEGLLRPLVGWRYLYDEKRDWHVNR